MNLNIAIRNLILLELFIMGQICGKQKVK